jgi:hypothetical protein
MGKIEQHGGENMNETALQEAALQAGAEKSPDPLEEKKEESAERGVEETPSFENAGENDVLDPQAELGRIGDSLQKNEAEIQRIQEAISSDKERLAKLHAEMGIPYTSTDTANAKRLNDLLGQREKLEEKKENAETADALNEVLERLNELPKPELKIIIETGKNKDGRSIEGKNGVVNPDVAKKLGKLAEQGAKKVTKAILNTIAGLVKGVLKAIFGVEDQTQ